MVWPPSGARRSAGWWRANWSGLCGLRNPGPTPCSPHGAGAGPADGWPAGGPGLAQADLALCRASREVRTWTERAAAVRPRAMLTERAWAEACRRVGKDAHAVAAGGAGCRGSDRRGGGRLAGQGAAACGLCRQRLGSRPGRLECFYRWADGVGAVELSRLARTVRSRWVRSEPSRTSRRVAR
jgi:hypothetical protein